MEQVKFVELSQIEKRDINGGNVPVARTASGFICGFLANLI